ILNAQRFYGDPNEPNDDIENATFVASFPGADVVLSNVSIDDDLDPDVREAVRRTVAAVDALPDEDRDWLYDGRVLSDVGPLTASSLADAVAREWLTRASLRTFDEADPAVCVDAERAGEPRVSLCPDIDSPFEGLCPQICRITTTGRPDGIRTQGHVPPVKIYEPSELEQVCNPDPVRGDPNCSFVRAPDCTGPGQGGACLHVPAVRRGETVVLEGTGFFSTDARVRLTGNWPSTWLSEVDAHVCGDTEAATDSPNDCAHITDRLTFEVPDELPVGRYWVAVVLDNDVGDPEFTRDTYASSSGVMIEVLAPEDATFQLVAETLDCVDETNPDWLGSDELGGRIVVVTVSEDGTIGDLSEGTTAFEFGDLDSGDTRTLDRVLFSGPVDTALAMTVVGFEIDNREAYEQGVRAFEDAYARILETNWAKVASAVGALTKAGVTAAGGSPALAEVAGKAIEQAFIVIVAVWAPADPVIEDAAGLSHRTMSQLTSLNFELPEPTAMQTSMGIDASAAPCEECDDPAKLHHQYLERRRYRSDDQGSTYEIVIRYNRL
ncbi:MAG: hypothetical protein AAF211_02065, partial [Myxococcota bacterium]